jgi:hypothetical protein
MPWCHYCRLAAQLFGEEAGLSGDEASSDEGEEEEEDGCH